MWVRIRLQRLSSQKVVEVALSQGLGILDEQRWLERFDLELKNQREAEAEDLSVIDDRCTKLVLFYIYYSFLEENSTETDIFLICPLKHINLFM